MSIVLQQPIVSKSDKRLYKLIKLTSNDLEVMLISDPTTETSAAAVNVNAGSLQDPVERQGLAHFLEHMCFLGTKKYPDATEFEKHLNQHFGCSNASTSMIFTDYHFCCSNAGFKEALDRFAWFFIDPLFTQDLTTKEMNAVNSEYEENLRSDAHREYQIFRSTSKEGYPFNRFGSGNLETLNFESIRDDLIRFYNQYYSSNLTKVAVLSNKSLEELEKQAVELFSQVSNRNLQKPVYNEIPFDSSNLKKFLKIIPCSEYKKIQFTWILPYDHSFHRKEPAFVLSRLLSDQGENSLSEALIDAGYALAVGSNSSTTLQLFQNLDIVITLTEKGFENYEKVIHFVSAYTKMLKEKSNQAWLHNEIKKIQQLNFDYKDKQEPYYYTKEVVSAMQLFEHIEILIQSNGPEAYDKDVLQTALDALVVDNLRISLISPTLNEECDLTEKWYQTKYSIEPLPESIIKAFEHPKIPSDSMAIDLPVKNPLLPTNFELFTSSEDHHPKNLINDEKIEFWYKQDSKFNVPKTSLYLYFKFKDMGQNTQDALLECFWKELFYQHTKRLIQQTEKALLQSCLSLNYRFDRELCITIDGFTDSITTFIELYLQKLIDFDVEKFKKQYQSLLVWYKQIYQSQSKQPDGSFNNTLLVYKDRLSLNEYIEQTNSITFEDVIDFQKNLLKQVRLELYIGGSITQEAATNIANIITTHVFDKKGALPLQKADVAKVKLIQTPLNEVFIYTEVCELQNFSYICVNFECGEVASFRNRNLIILLSNILSQSFYSQLRTHEQLGYTCYTTFNDFEGVGFLQFVIESDVQPPQYLSSRIANFICNIH